MILAIQHPNVGSAVTEAIVEWHSTTQRERHAWANETDATEAGAYGLALAGVELEGLVAVRRAETRTGADYYISIAGSVTDDLESCVRLEVSGIDRGDEAMIRQRLRQKVRQALAGLSSLPAMAAVVGFRARLLALARAEDI
jgi:hypothetical protein